jgi:ornithine cyclodeaminase
VLLFETEHGQLVAMIDASSITGIRTAATSGAATRALARQDAGDLAMIGSGVQAITHLEAMTVRALRCAACGCGAQTRGTRVFLRSASRKKHGIDVEPRRQRANALEGADIVCHHDSSRRTVLHGGLARPGRDINAVGACFPTARELDTNAMLRSRLFVDCRESALNEAGDFLIPKNEGAITDDHIVGEVGEVFVGTVKGRRSADEITLFKSLGSRSRISPRRTISGRRRRAAGDQTVDFGGHRIG